MGAFSEYANSFIGLWVKFWVTANERGGQESLGMWVGVYILWGVLTEMALAIEC